MASEAWEEVQEEVAFFRHHCWPCGGGDDEVPRQAVGRGGERAISTLMVTTVGTLPQGYVRNVPLPRIPLRQSTSSNQMHMIPDYYEVPHGVPPYNTSRSIVENAAYAFSPAWHAIAIYT